MNPTIGRIVKYKLKEEEKEQLRALSNSSLSGHCNISDESPATIVAVWSEDSINAKVHLDGAIPDLWVTSIQQGEEPGQWNWFQKN